MRIKLKRRLKMEKLNNGIWTVIGILFGLQALGQTILASVDVYLIALGFLVVGITGLLNK